MFFVCLSFFRFARFAESKGEQHSTTKIIASGFCMMVMIIIIR